MTELVIAPQEQIALLNINGELRVDSREIAGVLGLKHRVVLQLIEKHQHRFERLAPLTFEMEVRAGQQISGGGLPTRFALLNEDQCYLLLTFSRNTEHVVALKLALVQAFREARNAPRPALDMSDPLILAQQFIVAETERRALAEQLAIAAPKAQQWDSFMDSDGLVSLKQAANALAKSGVIFEGKPIGRTGLMRQLRDDGHLCKDNTPSQQRIDAGHFVVHISQWTTPKGDNVVSTSTRVTPRGLDWLSKYFA